MEFSRGFEEGKRAAQQAHAPPPFSPSTSPPVQTRLRITHANGSTTVAAGGPSDPDEMPQWLQELVNTMTPGFRTAFRGLYTLFITHLLACVFLPWTMKESWRVGLAALTSYGAILMLDMALGQISLLLGTMCLLVTSMSMLPGVGICWWRQTRFRSEFTMRFESERYRELRGELESARRIHESCLPAPVIGPAGEPVGGLRLVYAYRPMNNIGGDLLMHRLSDRNGHPEHLVALIDVTGHGIVAALTVNRLLGEIERLIGEQPDASPAQILRLLNQYVSVMLAGHGLYLSALILRLAPGGRVTYASGGHPTAYLLSPRGPTRELSSTAMLLGVASEDEFDAYDVTLSLAPDELLVACTDGATETTLEDGRMLLTAGMRSIVEDVVRQGTPLASVPETCMRRLDSVRAGGPHLLEDDTLVVAISCE